MTAFFLIIILGATAKKSIAEFGGLVIGLVVALMRQSNVPPARLLGSVYVELFRALPALLTILDDDPAPAVDFSRAAYSVGEGDGVDRGLGPGDVEGP